MIYIIIFLSFAIFAVGALRFRDALDDRNRRVSQGKVERFTQLDHVISAPTTDDSEDKASEVGQELPSTTSSPGKRRNLADTGQAIVLYRIPRRGIETRIIGESWFGGLPRLGSTKWPTDNDGKPLHHILSVSLEDLASSFQFPNLPLTGRLSCFVGLSDGDNHGTIIYVPETSSIDTTPPDTLLPLYDPLELPQCGRFLMTLDNARTFGRRPMGFRYIDFGDDAPELYEHEEIHTLLEDLGPSKDNSKQSAGPADKVWYWDTAQRFATSLVVTSDILKENSERSQSTVPADNNGLQAGLETFLAFVVEVNFWAFEKSRTQEMNEADITVYKQFFEQVSGNRYFNNVVGKFSDLYHVSNGAYGSELSPFNETLDWLKSGPDAVFKLLPTETQIEVDQNRKLAGYNSWHQMFGPGQDMQGAAESNRNRIMLLQLSDDQLMGLDLAGGQMQFWIDPEDLKRGRWENVTSTFEC